MAKTTTNAGVHVRFWSGGPSFELIDLTNAGKRGKTCLTLSVRFWGTDAGREQSYPVRSYLAKVAGVDFCRMPDRFTVTGATFGELAAVLVPMVQAIKEKTVEHMVHADAKEIRGIDAPRPILTAGKAGVWSASASIDSVGAADLTDVHNEPTATSRCEQSKAAAYNAAAKVWAQVEKAETYHQVVSILSGAGVNLHTYCARD